MNEESREELIKSHIRDTLDSFNVSPETFERLAAEILSEYRDESGMVYQGGGIWVESDDPNP